MLCIDSESCVACPAETPAVVMSATSRPSCALRPGSRLSTSEAIFDGSNFGFGFSGFFSTFFSGFFSTSFLISLSSSAWLLSGFGGSGFLSGGFGRSAGFGSGGGGGYSDEPPF